VETDLPAELYPLKSIGQSSEMPEEARGLKCRLVDLSEGGVAIMIGGKARVGLPVKAQFTLGETVTVMSGVVKGLNFDQKKNRSLLHLQATPPSSTMRNRILIYVYNLFEERETLTDKRKPAAPVRPATEGIVLKASPPTNSPATDPAGG